MKNLILISLLVFPMLIMGQDYDILYNSQDSALNIVTYEVVDEGNMEKYELPLIRGISNELITVNLLLMYAEECYNDSVVHDLEDVWIIQSKDSLSLVDRLAAYEGQFDIAHIKHDGCGYYQLWVNKLFYRHRTPSFVGFLEWIKRRNAQ